MLKRDEDRTEAGERIGAERSRPQVNIAGRQLPLPRSRIARLFIGGVLILLGLFGFLPVLGFWMVPMGLLVLSYDLAPARRLRRRLEVWWHRRRKSGPAGGK